MYLAHIKLFSFFLHPLVEQHGDKTFWCGCSSLGSWLKINESVLINQGVKKKTKKLNMCRRHICIWKITESKISQNMMKSLRHLMSSVTIFYFLSKIHKNNGVLYMTIYMYYYAIMQCGSSELVLIRWNFSAITYHSPEIKGFC